MRKRGLKSPKRFRMVIDTPTETLLQANNYRTSFTYTRKRLAIQRKYVKMAILAPREIVDCCNKWLAPSVALSFKFCPECGAILHRRKKRE